MYENNIFCIHQFHNARLFDNHTLTFGRLILEFFILDSKMNSRR